MAVHYDRYDVFKSPVEDFIRAAGKAGWRDRIEVPRRGDVVALRRST